MDEFRVLLVDDEDDFRETLQKRLRHRQVHAEVAESGYKALEILLDQDFDVVLLDVKMPGLDGLETLKEIKKIKPKVEVIILTGHASVESGIQGLQWGAFDYVMKPVPLEELLDKMRQAGDRQVSGREKDG